MQQPSASQHGSVVQHPALSAVIGQVAFVVGVLESAEIGIPLKLAAIAITRTAAAKKNMDLLFIVIKSPELFLYLCPGTNALNNRG